MPRLKIDTKRTLYEPIEIEIGGRVFPLKKVDRAVLRRIRELDAETQKGNLDAAYERLELLIGKHKFIDDLALENLIEITNFVIRSIIAPTKKEKNEPGPGAKKSQS